MKCGPSFPGVIAQLPMLGLLFLSLGPNDIKAEAGASFSLTKRLLRNNHKDRGERTGAVGVVGPPYDAGLCHTHYDQTLCISGINTQVQTPKNAPRPFG